MRTPDYLAALAELDVLAECSRTELKHAARFLTRLHIPAGEVVLRQDTAGREFLIVADGQLTVTRRDAQSSTLLNVVSTGEIVGEMSLLHRTLRTATVTTLTPTTVYAGSVPEFFAFMDAVPSAAERIIATAAERQRSNVAA